MSLKINKVHPLHLRKTQTWDNFYRAMRFLLESDVFESIEFTLVTWLVYRGIIVHDNTLVTDALRKEFPRCKGELSIEYISKTYDKSLLEVKVEHTLDNKTSALTAIKKGFHDLTSTVPVVGDFPIDINYTLRDASSVAQKIIPQLRSVGGGISDVLEIGESCGYIEYVFVVFLASTDLKLRDFLMSYYNTERPKRGEADNIHNLMLALEDYETLYQKQFTRPS